MEDIIKELLVYAKVNQLLLLYTPKEMNESDDNVYIISFGTFAKLEDTTPVSPMYSISGDTLKIILISEQKPKHIRKHMAKIESVFV